ncbi:hypothetical protein [Streptomyces guryensis]|uniref:Uncharacterized protein n=1 Tax=Streptomyces guryensis TaxID=2886947 RepID=A0A9Q3Z646_9ACTN|nr:hypothetical protein [Streptomyces guryensis]MCD9874814.1 hypothetical protein [Streptomyces guryensis]
MAPSPDDLHRPPFPAGSPRSRDHGLRRSRRVTRWTAVTAVAGAVALGTIFTHLLPGTSASPAPPGPAVQHSAASTVTTTGRGDDQQQGEDGGAAPAAQPPAQPPTASQAQPHTTTGAS